MRPELLQSSVTYPLGYLDFLSAAPEGGHCLGDYEMTAAGLARFNGALRALSAEAPALTLDQVATAAQRSLERYRPGQQPAFVTSKMAAMDRLRVLAGDAGWETDANLRRWLDTLQDYLDATDDLIPDDLPVVGRLDDAVLVDVALQLVRDDLGDYEDFCRFRQVAADFAGVHVHATGLTRAHWLEALLHARGARNRGGGRDRIRYVPDPRASLFHVI